jgi:hypothetical protein
MYNLIKVKQIDGAGLSGVFYEALNNEYTTGVISDLIFSNAIFKTGDQTISGTKNFDIRPTVRYTGVLISGDNAGYVSFNYSNYAEKNVNEALKRLYDVVLYTPPQITIGTQVTTIPGYNGTVEKGQPAFVTRVNWVLTSGAITGQRIVELPQLTLTTGDRTLVYQIQITQDTTFTLNYGDARTPDKTASTTVFVSNKRYWGASVSETLDNNAVLGLEYSEFATYRNQERYFNPGGAYMYFAWPASFGEATFRVNGLSSSSWILSVLSFTNTKGFTENYNIYRSEYKQFGTNIRVEVL